tara:strand:- start:1852 stop:1989 length:138 start_codon:yes stop_codon:yes gene_type:complete
VFISIREQTAKLYHLPRQELPAFDFFEMRALANQTWCEVAEVSND